MLKQLDKLQDLIPDSQNVNKGSERGNYMLDWSISQLGAGRSILADADGRVIAGNKTLDAASERDLPIRVVQTDGTELVVVQRTDLRLNGEGNEQSIARQLAIADNRTSEIGYVADAEILLAHLQSGIDLSAMYRDGELADILQSLAPDGLADGTNVDDVWQGMPEFENENSVYRSIIVHFTCQDDVDSFAKLMQQTITEKTKWMWHPHQPNIKYTDYVVVDGKQ